MSPGSGDVVELIDETPRVRIMVLDVPSWPGHLSGQHVDIRLTAEDGYQAQHSYSIRNYRLGPDGTDDGRPHLKVVHRN